MNKNSTEITYYRICAISQVIKMAKKQLFFEAKISTKRIEVLK